MAEVCLYRDEAAEGDLPRVCICCGDPDAEFEERSFVWYPLIAAFMPLVRLFTARRMRALLPFCGRHGGGLNLFAKNPRQLWGLRPTHMSSDTITIAGVSEEFVDAVERYRDGDDPDARPRSPRTRARDDRDEDRGRDLARRVRRPSPRPTAGWSGWTVLLIVFGIFVGMPILVCSGLVVLSLVMPRPPRPAPPGFGPPPFAQGGGQQAQPGNARPEDAIAMIAFGQEGFPGNVPWGALALAGRPDLPRPPSDAEVRKALDELASQSVFAVRDAAEKLAKVPPVEKHRKEAAAALLKVVQGRRGPGPESALKALAVWGTAAEVPALLAALEAERSPPSRASIIQALGGIKDERAAEPLAKRLPDFWDHDKAAEALKSIGRASEKAVRPYLQNKDRRARIKACEVLEAVGTDESVADLQAQALDKDQEVARAAQKALDAISARRDAKKPEKEGA